MARPPAQFFAALILGCWLSACNAPEPRSHRQAVTPTADPAGPSDKTWNDEQIAWRSYTQGLSDARSGHKPVCLVFYTRWCPHCTAYSKVFSDARVVAAAKNFVMVRVDADSDKALSSRFAVDGTYIPRTYFLSPEGELAANLRARDSGQFQFFYEESDPASLLSGMQRALRAYN